MSGSGPAPGRDRRSAALQQLAVLNPPPLRVVERPRRGTELVARWVALPTATEPRILVGVPGGSAAATVIRRQMSAKRRQTRLARAGLAGLARTGLLTRLRAISIGVTGPADAPNLANRLATLLGRPQVYLTLPIGPARANRKPVVQVTDVDGRVLAYCKVGHNPLTTRLVGHETQALRTLAGSPQGFRVPRVLDGFPWEGGQVVVLEALTIPSRRPAEIEYRKRLVDLVGQIGAVVAAAEAPWRSHPHRDRLQEMAQACGSLAEEITALVAELPGHVSVRTGSWHGDLNSGNFAMGQDETFVWDWERFEAGVPLGFDLLHHDLHQAITVDGMSPAQAATALLEAAPATLAPLGVQRDSAAVVAKSYLLTLAARYAADDQTAAGGDLGRVEEWLLPAVRQARGEVGI